MADARTAFLITIANEGGFQNSPRDKGNWTGGQIGYGQLVGTKYGISAAQFPYLDIKNLSPEDAISIYIKKYWDSFYSLIANQELCNKLADMGVLFGVGTAVGMLQKTLGVAVDHNFGPVTLAATNAADASLLPNYKINMAEHANAIVTANPLLMENLKGWLRRISS